MDGQGNGFDVDFRLRDIGLVQLQITAEGSKFAADIRDHVADLETNGRVGRVDRPGRNRGEWIDGGKYKTPSARSLASFNSKDGRIEGSIGRKGHAPVFRTDVSARARYLTRHSRA